MFPQISKSFKAMSKSFLSVKFNNSNLLVLKNKCNSDEVLLMYLVCLSNPSESHTGLFWSWYIPRLSYSSRKFASAQSFQALTLQWKLYCSSCGFSQLFVLTFCEKTLLEVIFHNSHVLPFEMKSRSLKVISSRNQTVLDWTLIKIGIKSTLFGYVWRA